MLTGVTGPGDEEQVETSSVSVSMQQEAASSSMRVHRGIEILGTLRGEGVVSMTGSGT